jgi:hypothetical protein
MACFGELNFLAAYFATLSVKDKSKVVSLLLFCHKTYWRIGGERTATHVQNLCKKDASGSPSQPPSTFDERALRIYWIKGCLFFTAGMNSAKKKNDLFADDAVCMSVDIASMQIRLWNEMEMI